MPLPSTTVKGKDAVIKLIFTLCERLGLASATSVGGAAMVVFRSDAFPPAPGVAWLLGVFVMLGGLMLAFLAAAMFVRDVTGHGASRINVFVSSTIIVVVTVCFVLAVVHAGIAGLSH